MKGLEDILVYWNFTPATQRQSIVMNEEQNMTLQ